MHYRGHEIDLKRPWKRVKLVDALQEHGVWSSDAAELRSILEGHGIDTTQDKTCAQLIDHALTNYVEPRLIEPTFLYDYPVALSPFARLVDGSDDIVERFEGFVGGTEICNAFSELNDSEEQARALRAAGGGGRGRQRRGGAGRPGLRRGALLRHAADRRARLRHRPARDGAARQGLGPRRRALPGAALQGLIRALGQVPGTVPGTWPNRRGSGRNRRPLSGVVGDVTAFLRLPRRPAALALMVLGQSALALLAPSVAAGPALASFVAAGVVLAR